jgi:palmitoyltransferase ZDHHC9/14/18
MPDRGTANASPSGADTLRSAGESEAPLSGADYSPRRHIPANLDLTRPFKSNTSNQPPQKSPRSPISFRSSFIIPNRNSRASIARRQEGHEKLESDPPTPHTLTREETKEQVRRELGKNYEYFAGNTRFFWGGRVQNAREVPINVATGLAILVPAVLFFVFSWVD